VAWATYFFINSDKEVGKKSPPRTDWPSASLVSIRILNGPRMTVHPCTGILFCVIPAANPESFFQLGSQ
jgi:hypothetical protein